MKFALMLALALLATAPLSSERVASAQKVSAGYDKAVSFANYKTFMFANKDGARNPFVNQMILAGVERELTARGLTKVEADADLRVSYLTAYGFNLQVHETSFGYNVNPAYKGLVPTGVSGMMAITEGTLLIDLFDNKTDRVVFRGTAKDVLERMASSDAAADAKMVSKPVNNSIKKIFKQYPSR